MWTIAAIPRQSRLGVDRSIRLGGNEVEAANMGVGDERTVLECAADAGWIEAGEDLSAALPALGQGADVHHLAIGSDGDIAVGAIIRARHDLHCRKWPAGKQIAGSRASRDDWTAAIEYDPDVPMPGRDSGLVGKAEETPLLGRVGVRPGRLRDVRDSRKAPAAVFAVGHRHRSPHVEK